MLLYCWASPPDVSVPRLTGCGAAAVRAGPQVCTGGRLDSHTVHKQGSLLVVAGRWVHVPQADTALQTMRSA